jgi:WD40 repeat protein
MRELDLPGDPAERIVNTMLHKVGTSRVFAALSMLLTTEPVRAADEATPSRAVWSVAFSPDGNLLAAGTGGPTSPGQVTIWESSTHRQRFSRMVPAGVSAVAFSPDGKTLAVGGFDSTTSFFDIATGEQGLTLQGQAKGLTAIAYAPDGKTLAMGGQDRIVQLRDAATGTARRTLAGPVERILSVAFSPDGKLVAAACGLGGVYVWDAASGETKYVLRQDGFYMTRTVFTPDGGVLTAGYDGSIRLWDAATGAARLKFEGFGSPRALAFSAAAQSLAVSVDDNDILLFGFGGQAPTAEERARIETLFRRLDDNDYATREKASKELSAIGFVIEPELRRLAKESPSPEVRIRCRQLRQELLTEPRAVLHGHGSRINSLAFSPDGKLLASGSEDGEVRLWNVATGDEAARLEPAGGR